MWLANSFTTDARIVVYSHKWILNRLNRTQTATIWPRLNSNIGGTWIYTVHLRQCFDSALKFQLVNKRTALFSHLTSISRALSTISTWPQISIFTFLIPLVDAICTLKTAFISWTLDCNWAIWRNRRTKLSWANEIPVLKLKIFEFKKPQRKLS